MYLVNHSRDKLFNLESLWYRVSHSEVSMQSKLALRGRRNNNFIESWCLVALGGFDFCVLLTSFQKNEIS